VTTNRERNTARQNPVLPSEGRASAASETWLVRKLPSKQPGVVWLLRPMPDGQWPADQRRPRDDSYSWWVRSHCGHEGGAKQWAFYQRADAELYEQIFRADPCHYTRCVERIMIENDPKRSRR
jgi:hypothetical protein